MTLLPSETIHSTAANGQLSLTNFRVVKFTKSAGVKNYSSILFENISSVRFVSHDYKWFLYIGFAIMALGLVSGLLAHEGKAGPIIGGIFAGGIFVGIYFATRKQYLEICAKGSERISVLTQEGFEPAYKFICNVEQAMKDRTSVVKKTEVA